MEFPTLCIPTSHQIWFQMPLDGPQISIDPLEGDLSPPQICARNPMCAESPSLQHVRGANVLVTQGHCFKNKCADLFNSRVSVKLRFTLCIPLSSFMKVFFFSFPVSAARHFQCRADCSGSGMGCWPLSLLAIVPYMARAPLWQYKVQMRSVQITSGV